MMIQRGTILKKMKKSWIVTICRDVGKNVQVSDRVLRLQSQQASVYKFKITFNLID